MKTFSLISFAVVFVGVLLLCNSCYTGPSNEDLEEFYDWQAERAPLTQKEAEFTDSLLGIGFKVYISHPFADRVDEPIKYEVELESDSIRITDSNYDFLMEFREKVALKLQQEIIADSIRHNLGSINVRYRLREARFSKKETKPGGRVYADIEDYVLN